MHWPTDREAIRQTYQDDGFAIARRFCDGIPLQELRHQLDRYVEEVVPTLPAMDVFFEDKSERRQIRMLPRMQEHDDYFHRLLTTGPLRDLAEALFDSDVVPQDAAFFNKLARIGEPTPPHQDGFYFHLNPCEALTLWLALDDVDEENGCVHYVAGSHKHGMRDHARTQVLGFSQGITDFGTPHDLANETPACVTAGDLIMHDAMTVHRTEANHSPRSRRALGFVYFSSRARVDEQARERYQQKLATELSADGKI